MASLASPKGSAADFHDAFVKLDGAWLFAERKLYVDWIETRVAHQ